ncbi:transthyretin [Pristis pectinata]|uniref:transthyretin n=1 Tax=Pristis pectinata TaxID=685728 RepID=UPI00223CB382|nr:transthyretin [Pristis pectinata]
MLRTLLLITFALSASCAATSVSHGGHDEKCPILIKVLDAVNGTPAANLRIEMLRQNDDQTWHQLNTAVTGGNGEVHNLTSEEHLSAGLYKVHFETGAYWRSRGFTHFHECADVVFRVPSASHDHYTLAVLLSPYSYSTTGLIRNPH